MIIDTKNMSIFEQIDIFSSAQIIIGPTGSALTNIIFCSERKAEPLQKRKQHGSLYSSHYSIIDNEGCFDSHQFPYHQPRGMLNKNTFASDAYVERNTISVKKR
jgi:capsular polysaccharide biosynthesis protein